MNYPTKTNSEGVTPAYGKMAIWCRISGMGRSAAYDALARGDLRAIKRGRSTLIDITHGLAWLRSLPLAQIGGRRNAA